MWRLRNNIDLVQVNLNNNDGKFYIPENVDFRDKRINNVMLLGGNGNNYVSPFDGRTLVHNDELRNFYVEFVSDDKKVLFENVNGQFLKPYSNLKFAIDSVISLKLSSITYVGTDNMYNKCLLLYVSYSGSECDPILPTNSVSVNLTIPRDSTGVKLSYYIDEYIKRQNKCVKAIETACDFDYYLTLQERKGRVFRFVPSQLFRSDYTHRLNQPLMLGNFDVDFKNSYILPQQAENDTHITLTLYY